MRKTKIVCTLGPATDNVDTIVSLIREGMDVCRLNFSHGSHEEHGARIALIRKACGITGKHIPILQDTKGIKIRAGYVQGYSEENKGATMELVKGTLIRFVCDSKKAAKGGELSTPTLIYVDYDLLASQLKVGQHILLDDGLVGTEILKIEGNVITVRVLNSGRITSKRSVNIPGAKLDLEFLTPQDRDDILFGISQDVDYIALSFTRRLDDVVRARKFLDANGGKRIMIIAKIENQEGVENLDDILTISDGVMVARGDMAVELPYQMVPAIQKRMIAKALAKGKIVITATQMLHSMIKEPTPTRAEVSDIFNAVEDSTTCIMLSGETASGSYPLEAVHVMNNVALSAEAVADYESIFSHEDMRGHVTTSICHAAVDLANRVNAKAIVAYSESGLTAKRLSALRTAVPLIVISCNEKVARQCHMLWGVTPLHQQQLASVEEMYTNAMATADAQVGLEDGDNIVVVAGTVLGVSGSTNSVRVITKGDVILRGTAMNSKRAQGAVKICKDSNDAAEKLKAGDIAVLYNLYPDMEPYLHKLGGILLASTEYDSHLMDRVASEIPVIIDVHAVETRAKDGLLVDVVGQKGVVLRK
jgi:pyruvate kinase